MNLRALRAPNHTLRSNISKGWQQRWSACSKAAAENFRTTEPCCKVPSCVDFTERMAGMHAPSWGASGFLSRPEGRVAALYPPERANTRPKKTAITSQNHCFGARGAGDFNFSCVLCRSKSGVDAYAPEAAVLPLDVLGKGQAILLCIFQQELAELLLRNWRFQIILAPLGVGAVEIGGAFLGVGLEADIRRCLHELGQVVAVRHGCFKVLDGALADGKLIAVRQQTV